MSSSCDTRRVKLRSNRGLITRRSINRHFPLHSRAHTKHTEVATDNRQQTAGEGAAELCTGYKEVDPREGCGGDEQITNRMHILPPSPYSHRQQELSWTEGMMHFARKCIIVAHVLSCKVIPGIIIDERRFFLDLRCRCGRWVRLFCTVKIRKQFPAHQVIAETTVIARGTEPSASEGRAPYPRRSTATAAGAW